MSEAWTQVVSLFLANAGLIIWFRTEARADWRHLDNKLDANQKEATQLIKAIQEEVKDFHIKLALQDQEFKNTMCKLEEKKNVNSNAKRKS
jgi:hypothetical protein